MIAYYETTKGHAGWSGTWWPKSLAKELEIVRASPLFALVQALLLRPEISGLVLDAGCGLGTWVAALAERGYRTVGVDAEKPPPSNLPVYQAKAENLWMVKGGDVGVYLSLGVIEHSKDGGDDILAEAVRVLRPGGLALISVPYVNGLRRLLWLWIVCRQEWKHASGATFYQWAFTKKELVSALAAHGLIVQSTHPYGPTKMFRTWFSEQTRDTYDAGASARAKSSGLVRRAIRWLLYTRPILRLCGHMLLVVAVKK